MKAFPLLIVLFFTTFSLTAQSECLQGDCINGEGICLFPSGARYEGNFKAGKLHGFGVLIVGEGRFVGHWQDQYLQGEGRFVGNDGSDYRGEFRKTRFHGQGKMVYGNRNVYEGQWTNGQPGGQGTLRFANGDVYAGQFAMGKFNGQGTMTYSDGSRYQGEWRDNLRHGTGTLRQASGNAITGQWADDQYQADWSDLALTADTSQLRNCNTMRCESGIGQYTYPGGIRLVGEFSSGRPHGTAVVYYPNGDRYEGGWQNDRREGRGVLHYSDGRELGAVWRSDQAIEQLFVAQKAPNTTITVDRNPAVKIWAVIVGAASYNHMPTLRYTDDDAYQIFAFLKSPEGGALPDDQLKVLIDENATRKNILLAMQQTFLRADENDVVLFYFSGHGLPGSFLPVDYDGFSNRLEHEEIRNALARTKAKHKLVLADACHAGSLLAARGTVNETLRRYYEAFEKSRGSTALLLSSKGEEYSLEDGGLRSGIFSHFLIRGLKGEADSDRNQIVTIKELFGYVHGQVRRYTGNVQTPTLTGDFDDAMPVGMIRQ